MSDERVRILVVDDDPSVRRIVAAMLGRWNYEVILAGDSRSAGRDGIHAHRPGLAGMAGR
jgi:CheY-like chemotaxis protein